MHSSCGLWATLFPLLLLTAPGPTSALTEGEKQTVVELHNFYRAQVSPPASDMLQMVSVAGCPPPGVEGALGTACHSPFPHPTPGGDALSDPFLWSVTESLMLCSAGPQEQPIM